MSDELDAALRRRFASATAALAATLPDAEFLHQQIPGSRLRIFPCGHLACIESAPAFAEAVTEFLAETA